MSKAQQPPNVQYYAPQPPAQAHNTPSQDRKLPYQPRQPPHQPQPQVIYVQQPAPPQPNRSDSGPGCCALLRMLDRSLLLSLHRYMMAPFQL
ncbi:hypothetical protein BS47DRAFT_1393785 [Hydnum rufescens UP504]|uniref:Uncharacterized protein n=1 Tax=Hydnum rufescens UP504 TaxID=1448309 RepID=A0A9P6DS60_9AGAM|nr:hypothetical protein BS47DRAFT_1393785 [Hydnum rufescens UP504]